GAMSGISLSTPLACNCRSSWRIAAAVVDAERVMSLIDRDSFLIMTIDRARRFERDVCASFVVAGSWGLKPFHRTILMLGALSPRRRSRRISDGCQARSSRQ